MDTVSHLVGPDVVIEGRDIQRCLVCGEKLCDSRGVMMAMRPDGTPDTFAVFPICVFVRVTVGQNPTRYEVLDDKATLPDDSCISLVE